MKYGSWTAKKKESTHNPENRFFFFEKKNHFKNNILNITKNDELLNSVVQHLQADCWQNMFKATWFFLNLLPAVLFFSKCIIIHHFLGCYTLTLFQTRINQVLKAYTQQDGVVNRGRDDFYTNSKNI